MISMVSTQQTPLQQALTAMVKRIVVMTPELVEHVRARLCHDDDPSLSGYRILFQLAPNVVAWSLIEIEYSTTDRGRDVLSVAYDATILFEQIIESCLPGGKQCGVITSSVYYGRELGLGNSDCQYMLIFATPPRR